MKRHLLLGRKAVTNLGSMLKSRDVTLLTKVCVVKAMVFLVVVHQCDSWSIKKTECRRIDFLRSFFIIIIIFLLYNIVLVLPYIIMHPPRVYMCSPSWTPLPPPSLYYPSESSQCTIPKLPVSCIEPGLVIHFLYDIIHVLMPFSQIIPPSNRVQKTVVYIFVSFAVSHTGLSLPSF